MGIDLSTEIAADCRVAVVSPHLDDAVLGCGDLIAAHPGATVITAFAGRPPAYPGVTSWDARAGFVVGDDVVAARREEDRSALDHLSARPVWLDFPDTQYGETPTVEAVGDALARTLAEMQPDVAVIPLALFHSDHQLTGNAALRVMVAQGGYRWLAYADAIYRAIPDLREQRLRVLAERGVDAAPVAAVTGPASEAKRRAIECYGSQLRALAVSWDGGHADAYEPEQYWSLNVAAPISAGGRRGGAAHGR